MIRPGMIFLIVLGGLLLLETRAFAVQVRITDTPIVRDLQRFGINLGDDRWYDGAALTKERVLHGGFEGVLFRQLTYGPGGNEAAVWDWFQPGAWAPVITKSTLWIADGSGQKPGLVRRIDRENYPDAADKGPLPKYTLETSVKPPMLNDPLLLEYDAPHLGYVGQHGGAWWVFTEEMGQVRSVAYAPENAPHGAMAVLLDTGDSGVAGILAPALSTRFNDPSGKWLLRFRAKGIPDAGRQTEVTAYVGDFAHQGDRGVARKRIPLSTEWVAHEIEFAIDEYTEELFAVGFHVQEGAVLLDDVSFVQLGEEQLDEENPTAFRYDVVRTLKELNPGVLRHLQIGGSSLGNILKPRLLRSAFSSSRQDPPPSGEWPGHPRESGRAKVHSYGLHEFLELCEQVGADPWYCLPGTFTPEEMVALVEYLNAPAGQGYGEVRAEHGRYLPWNAAFKRIYLEIGNEAWNEIPPFLHGGYSRKGNYWNALFSAGKASPHYSDNLVFIAGGQAANPERNEDILRGAPSADSLAIAPYLLDELNTGGKSNPKRSVFENLLVLPWNLAGHGAMPKNDSLARAEEKELSVYEVNLHTTRGDAPAPLRNAVAAGLGGALAVGNWMMLMLERFQVRTQNFFQLLQVGYPLGGGDVVPLWGAVLDMRPGRELRRPSFLMLMLLNRMLQGDLLRVHVDKVVFLRASGPELEEPAPLVQAFATGQRENRGLALFNLSLDQEFPATLEFTGKVLHGLAKVSVLSAKPGLSAAANNEFGHAPQVAVHEFEMNDFHSGALLRLPPFSLSVVQWKSTEQKNPGKEESASETFSGGV